MKKNKIEIGIILIISSLIFCLGMANAELNLSSVTLDSSLSKGSINYYWRSSGLVSVSVEFVNTDDVDETDLYCIVSDTENFNNCTSDETGEDNSNVNCLFYSFNESSSPISISGMDTNSAGKYTVYCQVCNATGYCDTTAETGSNSISFYVANFSRIAGNLLSILISIAISVGIVFAHDKINKENDNKRDINQIICNILIIFLLISIMSFIISVIIYGF